MGGRRRASEVVLPREEDEILLPAPKTGAWIARPRKSRPLLTYGVFAAILTQIPSYLKIIFGRRFSESIEVLTYVYYGLILLVLASFAIREWFARRMTRSDGMLVDGAFGE